MVKVFLICFTVMLFQSEAKLMGELQASLEKQYVDQFEKAQEQWKEEEIRRINDELLNQKEQLLKVSRISQLLLFSMRRFFVALQNDAVYLDSLKTVKDFCDSSRAALSVKSRLFLRCDSSQLFKEWITPPL